MNIFTNCPFCNAELTIKETRESKRHFCENALCKINGSFRFKMFTRDNDITHLTFLIEEFMVTISYLNNTTSICKIFQGTLKESFTFLARASESEVIISEAPEIKFGELDKLAKKIRLWMTFS